MSKHHYFVVRRRSNVSRRYAFANQNGTSTWVDGAYATRFVHLESAQAFATGLAELDLEIIGLTRDMRPPGSGDLSAYTIVWTADIVTAIGALDKATDKAQ